jgi:hypothetical protein
MENSEARIIADFNRGKISAAQAAKLLKRLAMRKGKTTSDNRRKSQWQ